jgi:hypothetical protein
MVATNTACTFSFSRNRVFPRTLVAAASVARAVVVGVGLLVYFKKCNRQAENDLVKKY